MLCCGQTWMKYQICPWQLYESPKKHSSNFHTLLWVNLDEISDLPVAVIYETGAMTKKKGQQIKQEVLEKERKKGFKISRTDRFKSRSRYFSDSGIIGTKGFVQKNYQRVKHLFQSLNEKLPKAINGLEGIYSLKRLAEEGI